MHQELNQMGDMRLFATVLIVNHAARFLPGTVVATSGALALLQETGFSAAALLSRHLHCDWGDCCAEDTATNEFAVNRQLRLFSVYRLIDPVKLADTPRAKRSDLPTVWIITEADRSVTTLLLPEEY